jgi:cytoskeletal protein RodZ
VYYQVKSVLYTLIRAFVYALGGSAYWWWIDHMQQQQQLKKQQGKVLNKAPASISTSDKTS